MIIKVKLDEAITCTLFVIAVLCYYVCVDILSFDSNGLDNVRYYMFAIAIAHGFILLISKGRLIKHNDKNFANEMKYIALLVVAFYVLSIIQAKNVNHELGYRTYIQLALLLIPALYSYCLVNLISLQTITKLFKIALIINILFYMFFEVGIEKFFILKNYLSISLISSTSPFETISNSETFLMFFCFFYYFRNADNNEKVKGSNNIFMWISAIFVFLSFKRLALAFLACVLLLGRLVGLRWKVPKNTALVMAITFTIITSFYTKFMQGMNFWGIDVYKFTTGRDYILSLWGNYNYLSYGYGSSYELIGRYLEMDLVQIYMELGAFAVFLFVFCFFKIARTNAVANIIILYEMLNLLTASSIPFTMGWIILLVTVASISTSKVDVEDITIRKKRLFYKRIRRG